MSEQVSLGRFCAYFLRLGTLGFGGPIALAGAMQRDLVEEHRWIDREDYVQGLALAQLAPGPLAAQLAIYLGWIRGGVAGATLVGIAFVLPSFVMVLGLSAAYVAWGGLRPIQALFYGIGAAVIGIIAKSAARLTRTTLKKDPLAWAIFAVLAAVTALTGREIVWLVLVAGALAMAAKGGIGRTAAATVSFALPAALATGLRDAASPDLLLRIFLFFAKAGAFVFGSGLAIVPFLYGGVVKELGWLNERQFLDAVAVAMITPGPVVITVAFIGYLVAGLAGATAAALGVFLPVWLFVVLPAPYVRRLAARPSVTAFVLGVTAAATGALAGAVVVIARGAIHDVPTALIAASALVIVWKTKTPEPLVVAVAGGLGLLLFRG
ncbi:MAG TPA: chromate efflux transporter [Thermoanaerobaculia bacterium]|nr:chromate efflux transporter [Thermoanaerobaculia bacterium]